MDITIKNSNDTLEIHREIIELPGISDPDPAWTEVCQCNTKHGYILNNAREVERPIEIAFAKQVIDQQAIPECGLPEINHWECIGCGFELTPGFLPPKTKTVGGRLSVRLNGEDLSHSEFIDYIRNNNFPNAEKWIKELMNL